MNLFKKLFGKSSENQKEDHSQKIDERVEIRVKKETSEFTYTDFNKAELENVDKNVKFFNEAFVNLLQFDKEPANHPENLDEYLEVWGSSGFGDFMGIQQDQHLALLAYNFGEYLNSKYQMKWQVKSDGFGEQTVIRRTEPIEQELYPVDSTIDAINNNKRNIYTEIERKLIGSINLLKK